MSDWATEEAERLSNLDRDTREESQWVCDQIASALRSAFHRGKVDGMREAGGIVTEHYQLLDNESRILLVARQTAINLRATALEQENKD
jgi:hypothetical protein